MLSPRGLLLALALAGLAGAQDVLDIPTVTLRNGVEMPMLALGTWQYRPDKAGNVTAMALNMGYTHLDTAHNYRNQPGIRRALEASPRERSSYFITSKVPGGCSSKGEGCHGYEETKSINARTLSELGVDYVDCMLVHFPPAPTVPSWVNRRRLMQAQWRALEDMYLAGQARAIGVSNFCQSDLDIILETCRVRPMVNQIMAHVGMGADPEGVVSYSRSKGLAVMAYSPLAVDAGGSMELIRGRFTSEMGKRYGKSSVQVSLRYLVQLGMVVLPKTDKLEHLQANAALFDWRLSEQDMRALEARTVPPGTPSFIQRCGPPASVGSVLE